MVLLPGEMGPFTESQPEEPWEGLAFRLTLNDIKQQLRRDPGRAAGELEESWRSCTGQLSRGQCGPEPAHLPGIERFLGCRTLIDGNSSRQTRAGRSRQRFGL